MANPVTCCTVNQKLYNEGTHLNWRVQPAGFAPPEVSGEVSALRVWQSPAERSLVCFGFCSEQNSERTAVALICYRGCSSSLLHNSVISYLQELVRTASMQVPSCVHGSVDKIHSYS